MLANRHNVWCVCVCVWWCMAFVIKSKEWIRIFFFIPLKMYHSNVHSSECEIQLAFFSLAKIILFSTIFNSTLQHVYWTNRKYSSNKSKLRLAIANVIISSAASECNLLDHFDSVKYTNRNWQTIEAAAALFNGLWFTSMARITNNYAYNTYQKNVRVIWYRDTI